MKWNWLDKPITWRNYLKLVGVCGVLSCICTAYTYWKCGLFKYLGFDDKLKKSIEKAKEKVHKETYFETE